MLPSVTFPSARGHLANSESDALRSDNSAQLLRDVDDLQPSSAIIAIRYRDKSGKLKTITTDATGFTFRELKPQENSQLKKNKG